MVTKLIPNDINILEQFRIRDHFEQMVDRWGGRNQITISYTYRANLKRLEEDSGVRCHYIGTRLAGYELVNEKAYIMFILTWG